MGSLTAVGQEILFRHPTAGQKLNMCNMRVFFRCSSLFLAVALFLTLTAGYVCPLAGCSPALFLFLCRRMPHAA